MTNRELLHQKLLEINPVNDLTIACDAFLDTDEKSRYRVKRYIEWENQE